tara:strand:+ start:16044 stop:16970 length:927 start_codon:yes stop_codon:yes gene_type:complete
LEYYITLFDSNFLPQGLALYNSLTKYGGQFSLSILCMDKLCYEILDKKGYPNVDLIRLEDFETKNLISIKGERTFSEYCWTLTPFTSKIVFDRNPDALRVTYLDADLWFRKSPKPIFKEFENSKKQVLITEHSYDEDYDQSEKYGKYCVQFMTFKRGGERIRKWWEEKCLEWCFAKFENGKFGDQKYLDDWLERFPQQVHVLSQKESIQAPWNAKIFLSSSAIIWHFHGLRVQKNRILCFLRYKIPYPVIEKIYDPYIHEIRKIVKDLTIEISQGKIESQFIRILRRFDSYICTFGKKFSKYRISRLE